MSTAVVLNACAFPIVKPNKSNILMIKTIKILLFILSIHVLLSDLNDQYLYKKRRESIVNSLPKFIITCYLTCTDTIFQEV